MKSIDELMGEPKITEAERRRRVLTQLTEGLMQTNPQLYYQSTAEIARAVHDKLKSDRQLAREDREAVESLTVRDIEVILAFK